MAAKDQRKESFMKRGVAKCDAEMKKIYRDIIKNAKDNSDDIDLKILEPRLQDVIEGVKKELKKDKDSAKATAGDVKAIIVNSFNKLKGGVKNNSNNLDEDDVDDWMKEFDDIDILGLIDDDDDEDEDDAEDSSMEYDASDSTIIKAESLDVEGIELAVNGAAVYLSGIADEKFKFFIEDYGTDVMEVIKYRVTNNVESPINVKDEDVTNVSVIIQDALVESLVSNNIALEEDIDVEDEHVDLGVLDEVDNNLVPANVTSDIAEDVILTEDRIDEGQQLIALDEANIEALKSFRINLDDRTKNILDLSISIIIDYVNEFSRRNPEEDEIETSPLHTLMNHVDYELTLSEIGSMLGSDDIIGILEIYLMMIMNIDMNKQ